MQRMTVGRRRLCQFRGGNVLNQIKFEQKELQTLFGRKSAARTFP